MSEKKATPPRQGTVWFRKSDGTEWVLYEKHEGPDGTSWTLRNRESVEYEKVSESQLLRGYVRLGSESVCEFPGCGGKRHGYGLCMGHLYQLKAYGDRSKLRPLHSYTYGDDAVRLEVRSGLLTREVAALRKLGGKVEAHDPRETNRANIAARHLVREYAAGRAVLAESEPLGQPTGKATVRVCLAHVGGGELDALTALGNTLTPKNRQDSNPALRALRYLIRAYANGALVLNPKQPS